MTTPSTTMPEEFSKDSFYNGRIIVHQYRKGYRFSIDAVILAHHAAPPDHAAVLDLGTGCGIVPLLMAFRNSTLTITGAEIQSELAELAARNVEINRMQQRIDILMRDMRQFRKRPPFRLFDMVVCNPPFRKAESGRINPNSQKALARHEIEITLPEIVDIAAYLLKPAGKLLMIYGAERLTDLVAQLRASKVEPKWMRMIHSTATGEAKLVLLSSAKGGRPGITIDPPLIIYQRGGTYTEEVQAMIAGDVS